MKLSNSALIFSLIIVVGCGRTGVADQLGERHGLSELRIKTDDGIIDYTVHRSFQCMDTVRHFRQELGLMTITPDSIKFVLLTITDSCEAHYTGYAINNYSGTNSTFSNELDENNTREYLTEGKQYVMRIRLDDSGDRAKILYERKGNENIGCAVPMESTMNPVIR